MSYHETNPVQDLAGTTLTQVTAFLSHRSKTTKARCNCDYQGQGEECTHSPYLQTNRVGHHHCHCLANADEDEVLAKVGTDFGNQSEGPEIDVLPEYPEDQEGNGYFLKGWFVEQVETRG